MDKESFREECLKKLKKIAKQQNLLAIDAKVNKNLQKLLKKISPKSILFYMPLNHEANIKKTIKYYKRKKIKVALPFMEGNSFVMIKSNLPMKVGRFGIKEPTSKNYRYKKIDCVVIPTIGVDAKFARIGHGKGMYDRFFETLKNKPISIFIQRILLQSKERLGKKHDIKADFVVTSKSIIKRGDKDANRANNRGCLCFGSWSKWIYHLKKAK